MEINVIINNPKSNMTSFKIGPNILKRFFKLTINNKYIKSAPIL